MAKNMIVRGGDGREIPVPQDRAFVEILTADGKVGMVIFGADGRVFIEQPGDPNFARYCEMFKRPAAERPVTNIKF